VRGAALRNFEAPVGARDGYMVALQPKMIFGSTQVEPNLGYFHHESDTLPAAYTSTGVGNSNREGFVVGLRTEFKDEDLALTASWVQANEVADNPYTANRTIISIGLETTYDLL
jgi:hypothetical protein